MVTRSPTVRRINYNSGGHPSVTQNAMSLPAAIVTPGQPRRRYVLLPRLGTRSSHTAPPLPRHSSILPSSASDFCTCLSPCDCPASTLPGNKRALVSIKIVVLTTLKVVWCKYESTWVV